MNVPTDNLTVLRPYRSSSSFDGKDARFYICIHQGSGTEISGEFRHLFMKEWYPFNSLANLILTLDQLLCPSYTLLHYPRLEDYREKKATFLLHIRYKQHSSWQGELKWLERRRSINFRSVLELMHFISHTSLNGGND